MKNALKRHHKVLLFISVSCVALCLSLGTPAHAKRQKVTCTFTVEEDASRNIKAAAFSDTEKVRRREYQRLVGSDGNAYRVIADGGYHCIIRHIENMRLKVRVDKRDLKLTPQGRIPNCSDCQIRVRCEGN